MNLSHCVQAGANQREWIEQILLFPVVQQPWDGTPILRHGSEVLQ